MSRRKSKKYYIILILLLLLGVTFGYAVLNSTLNINGKSTVQKNTWDVHFENIQVKEGSVTATVDPVISNNTSISNFEITLDKPGDFYEFTVDVVNDGSIDAMIESIIKTPELTDEQKKYLKYEVEYVDGTSISESKLLKSGETKTISVLFSYRNDISVSDLLSIESNFDLEIDLVHRHADNMNDGMGTTSVVKIVSGDLNTIGSEACISDECFYLINSDDYNLTLFAKYNLYVRGESTSTSKFTAYGDEATGIQDSTMLCWFR